MRILLLGNKAAGKSSSVWTILGGERSSGRTAQFVKVQGEVEGIALTVTEAPGWWRNYMVKDTPNLNAEEIVLSASDGLHVVLLVVRLDTRFTETCRRALEQRQLLFQSESVWLHSMVLFTFGDCLGEMSIEEHIESQGDALQWLVEKCENRFHVFDNQNSKDTRQVKELLEKVELMIMENGRRRFEVDSEFLHSLVVKRTKDEARVVERLIDHKQAFAGPAAQTQAELRILLTGHRHSGKSSVGNIILGEEAFDLGRTSKCVIKDGKVDGRQVTVVEAPGWWNNYCLKDTPELSKRELLRSASLCHPGPHALLLVLRADGSFTPENRRAVQEHLELFGEKVWDYTMVLFTYGDWLGETTIEQHIESEGALLRWLVDKCRNRYHVFDNSNPDERVQVTELLRKIESMTAGNGGHYEVDSVSTEERRMQQKTDEERAKTRTSVVMEKRQTLQLLLGDLPRFSELRIVMFGSMFSGKSSAGNTILGSEEFSLQRSSKCMKREGKVGTKQMTLVEAPGWMCSCMGQMDESVEEEIRQSVISCAPGPHAVLLVIQADTSFTEDKRRMLEQHLQVLDERVWNYTMVLFTCGDWLGDWSIEEHIESEGKALQWIVEMCRNRYHVLNNKDSGDRSQVTELLDKLEEMVAGNGGYLLVQVPKPPLPKSRRQREPSDIKTSTMGGSRCDEKDEKKMDMSGMDEREVSAEADRAKHWIMSDLPAQRRSSLQHSQPTMSRDNQSDNGSDYGSEASITRSESNLHRLLMSMASSLSSGIGSLRNFSARGFKSLHVFRKRPKTEEDDARVEIQQEGKLLLKDENESRDKQCGV